MTLSETMGLKTIIDHKHRILRTLDFVETHLEEPLSVKALARVACLSNFHFHRKFNYYIGDTVSGYIRGRRLTRAANRLVQSKIKITDLAYSVGYDTPEAFTKAFKKAFGRSPLAFRKNANRLEQRRIKQIISAVLLKPCLNEIDQQQNRIDIGIKAFSELACLSDQVGIKEAASTWISVFPDFHSKNIPSNTDSSSPLVHLGPLPYQIMFPGADAQFQVLKSGRTAVLYYRNSAVAYRNAHSAIPIRFANKQNNMEQPPLQMRSILCVPYFFQNLSISNPNKR